MTIDDQTLGLVMTSGCYTEEHSKKAKQDHSNWQPVVQVEVHMAGEKRHVYMGQDDLREGVKLFAAAKVHERDGMVLLEVPGDGSCFYHSATAVTGGDHRSLRKKTLLPLLQFILPSAEMDALSGLTLRARQIAVMTYVSEFKGNIDEIPLSVEQYLLNSQLQQAPDKRNWADTLHLWASAQLFQLPQVCFGAGSNLNQPKYPLHMKAPDTQVVLPLGFSEADALALVDGALSKSGCMVYFLDGTGHYSPVILYTAAARLEIACLIGDTLRTRQCWSLPVPGNTLIARYGWLGDLFLSAALEQVATAVLKTSDGLGVLQGLRMYRVQQALHLKVSRMGTSHHDCIIMPLCTLLCVVIATQCDSITAQLSGIVCICRYNVQLIMNCNIKMNNINEVLIFGYHATRCLMSQASGKEAEDKASAQGGWIHYKECGFRDAAPTITTKHRGPTPQDVPDEPRVSAKAHKHFPQAVGIVFKVHPQQSMTRALGRGEQCPPMQYGTVVWLAPADIAGTISKIHQHELETENPVYTLHRVAAMQQAFMDSQKAQAAAHADADVLFKLHAKQLEQAEADSALEPDVRGQKSQVYDTESDADDEEAQMLRGGQVKRRAAAEPHADGGHAKAGRGAPQGTPLDRLRAQMSECESVVDFVERFVYNILQDPGYKSFPNTWKTRDNQESRQTRVRAFVNAVKFWSITPLTAQAAVLAMSIYGNGAFGTLCPAGTEENGDGLHGTWWKLYVLAAFDLKTCGQVSVRRVACWDVSMSCREFSVDSCTLMLMSAVCAAVQHDMHFVAKVFKMSMTEVQLPHSAVYPTTGNKGTRHGPYNGDKMMSMMCPYTNCLAEPGGRAAVVTAAQVLVKKQANRMSTQGTVMASTATAVLHGQLETSGVISANSLHALVRGGNRLKGSAEVFMHTQFQVREYGVCTVRFEVNSSILATVHAQ